MRNRDLWRTGMIVTGMMVLAQTAWSQGVLPPPSESRPKGYLGVHTVITSLGIQITRVAPGSPAEASKFRPDDYIVQVDGYPVGLIGGKSYSLESELRRSSGTVVLKIRDGRTKKERLVTVKLEGETGLPEDEQDLLKERSKPR